ncbi:hypothetical protein [Azospirillum tabaci]|uniref:hypothetical protein n=1 Tax=Azospirillum tabaci TaxID=2752310 RepID=UPI001660F220|nr:hypothetical protein [Azospirillum tabaci]
MSFSFNPFVYTLNGHTRTHLDWAMDPVGQLAGTARDIAVTIEAFRGNLPGTVGNGVADDRAALVSWAAGTSLRLLADPYKMSSNYAIPEKNVRISIEPGTRFPGPGLFDMGNLTKYIGATPTLAYEALFATVDSTLAAYQHVVGISSFLKATVAAGPVLVALYGNAEAAVAGASVFGSNFGVLVSAPGATGIACEIDSHVTAAGDGYALLLNAVGSHPSRAALVISNNAIPSTFDVGISFNNAHNGNVITAGGDAIRMGEGAVGTLLRCLASCTVAEIDIPSWCVGPTVANLNSRLRTDGSAVGTPKLWGEGSAGIISPIIQSKGDNSSIFLNVGTATVLRATGLIVNGDYLKVSNGTGGAFVTVDGASTNAEVQVEGKGSGGVNLLAGDNTSKFRVSVAGIGFYGIAPQPRQTISGSRGGNSALLSLLNALDFIGLIQNGTSA